jgi:DNA-binding beta-propeller fold protein YncE
MRRRAALLTLALLLALGCSTRARLNPFDPANPSTGGRPSGFAAIAGNQSVRLVWSATTAPGLAGYQVFRRAPGDSIWRAITGVLPPAVTSQSDFGLLNGADHRYRLYFVLAGGALGVLPAEDVATPGPLRPWVAEFGANRLTRLSADGRHVAETVPAGAGAFPAEVAVDPPTGKVWAVGPDGDVLLYSPATGQVAVVLQANTDLESVVTDRSDSAWVADATNGRLIHLRTDGSAASPASILGLRGPANLAVDAANGSLWVVEATGDRVSHYRADGTLIAGATVPQPTRVAVDPVTHEAWVSSFRIGRVVRVASGGALLDTVTACTGPLGLAVDATHRRIWVADAAGDQVVALDPSGGVLFRVTGESGPREIAVDETSGDAWVTLGGANAAVRISGAGVELARVTALSDPWGVALDDVTRHAPPPPDAAANAGATRGVRQKL